MPSLADKIDLGERFALLDTMMLTIRHGTPFLEGLSGSNSRPQQDNQFTARLFTHNINWNPALRNANRWYDRCVGGLRITDRNVREQEIAAIIRDIKLLKQQVTDMGVIEKSFMGSEARGEMMGNVFIGLMLPAFDRVHSAAERCEQGQRNLHLALILAAYQHDHGHYPTKLEELTPKYQVKIPDDIFSGKPLIYRLEDKGYLLYSVGPNGTDDEGRGNDDEPSGDDLSVRMPVAKPRPQE
jgi:hypothetical protein